MNRYRWFVVCELCVVNRSVYRIVFLLCFFFQAEDGIRDLVRSRGLGDVYKRQDLVREPVVQHRRREDADIGTPLGHGGLHLGAGQVLSLIHI